MYDIITTDEDIYSIQLYILNSINQTNEYNRSRSNVNNRKKNEHTNHKKRILFVNITLDSRGEK